MTASGNARARVRAQLTEEIKDAARIELAVAGSPGLSLRAVARRVEMVPSALYRYFDSRDALLTALIIDAYSSLGAAVAAADGAAADGVAADGDGGPSPLRRWLAVGHAARDWAWAHPHEWGLIYGSPVPGYQAPQDTIGPALELVRVLAAIVTPQEPSDAGPGPGSGPGSGLGHGCGVGDPPDAGTGAWMGAGPGPGAGVLPVEVPVGPELERWLGLIRVPYLLGLGDAMTALAVIAYTYLLGAVSLELFGQFGPDATPAPAMFDHGLRVTGALLGITGPI